MNVIVISHSRRQAGADKDTRDALGYERRDNVRITGQNGNVLVKRVYRVPLSVASTLKLLRDRQGGNKNYLYLNQRDIDQLGVKSGDTVEIEVKSKGVAPIATTPGHSPTNPKIIPVGRSGTVNVRTLTKTGTTITDQIRSILPNLGTEFTSTQIAEAVGKTASNIWGNIDSLRKSREIVLVRTETVKGRQVNVWRRNSEER